MSRADWAVKLKHGKDEFISRLQHYWLGTKLLWADVRISSRLLVKLAGGKSLSRRERQQLTRTTADIFRLVPVAVFIIVPFMEFLLPVFLKLFPNMLPSTFQDKMKEEEALKRKLKARMEYAKFLLDPAKELAKEVKALCSGETKQTAEDLDEFLNKDVTNVGDEGGFAPNIQENKEGLELLKTAIEKAGYTGKVVIGMDVAASEFYNDKDKTYDLNFKEENNDDSLKISGDSLKNVYKSFVSEYPIGLIKDPVEQDDWMHYAKMTEEESLDYDFLVNNQMDHVLKASSQAKPEMTPYKRKVFQNGRTFSSIGPEPEPEVPVVKQLIDGHSFPLRIVYLLVLFLSQFH
ncbi:enolase isoform X2 [Triticum aestivum]|uniref:enolase isoform X2 n=1 Tax=Triticum aestivum TaxID=4565 RepID=UPI001D034793|nr:enolase-like isoform X2 [Triticum aestivum]